MSLTGNFDRRERNKTLGSTEPANEPAEENEQFVRAGRVRNLYFVQPDGSQRFLNYSYLVAGNYLPDENTIVLVYTSDEVTIKGRNLDQLFEKLGMHLQRKLVAVEKRYLSTFAESDLVITEINFRKV